MNSKNYLAAILATVMTLIAGTPGVFAETRDIITEQCGIQLQLSSSACTCIADAAEEELNELQLKLLIAQITDDNAAMAALAGQFTLTDLTTVGSFMNTAPQTCAGQ